LNFVRSQDLGFNNKLMLVVDTHQDVHRWAFNQEIRKIKTVLSSALSDNIPGTISSVAYSKVENKQGEMQVAGLNLYLVDYDYIPLYKLKIVAGRTFSKDFPSDNTTAIILNESAVKFFGYASPEEAIGHRYSQWGKEGKIIGVLKDFHYKSLQENIKPLSLRVEPDWCGLVSINISANNIPASIAAIQDKWEKSIPNRPFNYYFADAAFDKLYRAEDSFGNLFFNFAILAIFISCIGLLGLASYSTLQRNKEIGVRKVMGASVSNIVRLLSVDFILLVLAAFLIASPLAWFAMHQWLQYFAYRIDMHLWIFALAGIAAIAIAFGTISLQAYKAATANPIDILRSQ